MADMTVTVNNANMQRLVDAFTNQRTGQGTQTLGETLAAAGQTTPEQLAASIAWFEEYQYWRLKTTVLDHEAAAAAQVIRDADEDI